MSAPGVILAEYLAGIAMRGAESHDVVEVQSRVEIETSHVRAHATHTLDVVMTPPASDASALRDVSAGATVTLDSLRVVGEAHVLDATHGGPSGHAGYAGLGARIGAYEVALGAGAVWTGGELGHQLTVQIAWPRITSRLDATAIAIVTDMQLSAGAALAIHATRRIDVTLDALAGTRSRALLSEGQTVESLSGTQHELLRARAVFDLGRAGSVFAAASVRRDTSADRHDTLVAAVLAGTAVPF